MVVQPVQATAQTLLNLVSLQLFSLQGYFCKAEACKQLALMDSEKKVDYCQSATEAYLKAFELSECTDDHIDKTICRAIVFAVDYGKYTLILVLSVEIV